MTDYLKIKGVLKMRTVAIRSRTPRTEFFIKYGRKEYVIKRPGLKNILKPDPKLLKLENKTIEVEISPLSGHNIYKPHTITVI